MQHTRIVSLTAARPLTKSRRQLILGLVAGALGTGLCACVAPPEPPTPLSDETPPAEPTATPAPAPTRAPTEAPTATRPTPTPPATPAGQATPSPRASRYRESPGTRAETDAGRLPPVDSRLPAQPLVMPVGSARNYGGTLTVPTRSPVDTFTLESWFGHEPLLRWDAGWRTLRPNYAAAWDDSPDARAFSFALRPGVRWSDGKPATAADLDFWFREIVSDDEVSPVKPDWLKAGGKLGKLEVTGEFGIRFTFESPNGLFPRRLAAFGSAECWPQAEFARRYHIRYNKEQVERDVRAQGAPNWAFLFNRAVNYTPELGQARWYRTGSPTLSAWVVTSSLSQGPGLVARRNPYYWKVDPDGGQLPYLDEVRSIVADTPEAIAKLVGARGVDAVLAAPDDLSALVGASYSAVGIVPDSLNTCVIAPNLNHRDARLRALFRSRDFRIGLSLATHRADLASRHPAARGTPWQVAPRPESPYHDASFGAQFTAHDPAGARASFLKAGLKAAPSGALTFADGAPVAFGVEPPSTIAALVDIAGTLATQWKAAGLGVTVRPQDRGARVSRMRDATFDVCLSPGDGGFDPALSPTWFLPFSSLLTFAPLWARWYETRGADGEEPVGPAVTQQRLYDQLMATSDLAAQARLIDQILAIAREQLWTLGVSLPPARVGLAATRLGNLPTTIIASTREHVEPGSSAPETFAVLAP